MPIKNKTNKATLKSLKSGTVQLPSPIYASKPYLILSKEDVVLFAGTLEEVKHQGTYYDDCIVEVRRHDIHLNDNTRLTQYNATARPWQVNESKHAAGRCALGFEIVAGIRHIADVRVYEPCDQANAELIVRAVNEHAELTAVAVAACAAKRTLEQFKAVCSAGEFSEYPGFADTLNELTSKLANLSAIQQGKSVQS